MKDRAGVLPDPGDVLACPFDADIFTVKRGPVGETISSHPRLT
jgi:hypothetical protein